MKKYLLIIASVLMLAACSTPKYTYYFDHYDYNSGKKKAESQKTIIAENILARPEMSPLRINQDVAAANVESRIINTERAPVTVIDKKTLQEKYLAMSKAEKKEFKKELKSEIKKFIKAKKSGENINSISDTKALDHNLKLALIFGIVAIVLTAFSGANPIFWILGIIFFVVALVFFIQWLANQ